MDIQQILAETLEKGGSDVFIVPGTLVSIKVNGVLVQLGTERIMPPQAEQLLSEAYERAGRSMDRLNKRGDDDFSFSIKNIGRFRCCTYKQRGTVAATIRVVAFGLPDPAKMGIPASVIGLHELHSGLVLVTGSAGSGKSTTLACILDRINQTRSGHIITIEDPIEYLHPHRKCVVSQREVENDTQTFATALRAALRQAPDVILVGEMRDAETMQTALTAAETGHLVLSSLHTVGTAKTIDRIIDAFPANQQAQVRVQLSMVLRAVISQQLLPAMDGTLVPAFEIMKVTSAIQTMIRDGKTHQIDNVIYAGSAGGMQAMDSDIYRLWKEKKISRETALLYAVNRDTLSRRIV